MTDEPKLNRWGKVSTPPLTSDQKKSLLESFAKGNGPTQAAKDAGCSYGRARVFRNEHKNAMAVKDLQVTTNMVLGVTRLVDLVEKQTALIVAMEARLRANEQETRKLRASVAYQRLSLTKKREIERTHKAELKELKKMLHRQTGIDLT